MVRPFTLRDLALVRRLTEHRISLYAESALADDLHPLRGALTSLVGGGKTPTLIYKSDEREATGFIQLLLHEDKHHGHILYLSPALEPLSDGTQSSITSNLWLALVDKGVVEVGRLGVHSLVAEVDEHGPELPLLRQAGFAVYARQEIWRFDGLPETFDELPPAAHLLPYLSSDDWDIQLLYANIVPRLVQLVEPAPPQMNGDGWVLRDEHNELVAFIHIHEGSEATWLRFFLHPGAEADAAAIVYATLSGEIQRRGQPLYCCVRRYEGWLPAALERSGFTILCSQAVLVKHTVHYARPAEPKMAVNIERTGMPATSPYVRRTPKIVRTMIRPD